MGILPIIIFLIIGAGILAALKPPARTLHPAGWIALAWWLGLLATTNVVMAAAVMTERMHFWLMWVMLAVGIGLLIWKGRALAHEFKAALSDNSPHHHPVEPWFKTAVFALSVIVAILAARNVYYVANVGTSFPLVTFDAINNFGHKAQMWYETGDLQPAPLRDAEYIMYKRKYPPVVSMGEALWAYALGGWDGQRVKWMFAACWLSVGALVWAALRRRGNALTAWLGAGLWLCVPMNLTYFFGGAISGFADVPQAMAFVAAAAVAGELIGGGDKDKRRDDWGAVILAGLLLAGAFWIKKEGLVFWAAMMGILLVRRAGLARLGAMAGIAAALYAINALATRGLPDFLEKDITLDLPWVEIWGRVKLYPALLAEELDRGNNWGGELWAIYGAVWLYKFWHVPARRWVTRELAVFAAMAAVFSAILILTIHSYGRNFDWAFERLFIQILPLLIVATFSDFDPWRGREEAGLKFEAREPIPPEVARGA